MAGLATCSGRTRGGRARGARFDLDCTSPLRLPKDITGALTLFQTAQPDMVMSVCEARKNPYFNLVEPDETGALHVSGPLPGGAGRVRQPRPYTSMRPAPMSWRQTICDAPKRSMRAVSSPLKCLQSGASISTAFGFRDGGIPLANFLKQKDI